MVVAESEGSVWDWEDNIPETIWLSPFLYHEGELANALYVEASEVPENMSIYIMRTTSEVILAQSSNTYDLLAMHMLVTKSFMGWQQN